MTYTYKETVNRIVVWLDNARVDRLVCRKKYMEDGDEEKQLEAEHYAGAYQAAYSQAMRFWAEVDDTPDADVQELADLRKRVWELKAQVDELQHLHSKQRDTILELQRERDELQQRLGKALAALKDWHNSRVEWFLDALDELRQEAEKHEDTDA